MIGKNPLPHLLHKIVQVSLWRIFAERALFFFFGRSWILNRTLFLIERTLFFDIFICIEIDHALFFGCFSCDRWRFGHFHLRNQFLLMKSPPYCFTDGFIYFLLVLKTDLHFCGMYVDINRLCVCRQMQYSKRILVLHLKIFISVLNGFGYNIAFYIAPVYKIVFKIAVSP